MKGRQYRKHKDIQKITGGLGYAFFLVGMISASTYFGFLQDFINYEIYGDELNIACMCFFLSSVCFGICIESLAKLWHSELEN